jgi:hypothetical protein
MSFSSCAALAGGALADRALPLFNQGNVPNVAGRVTLVQNGPRHSVLARVLGVFMGYAGTSARVNASPIVLNCAIFVPLPLDIAAPCC